MYEVATGGSPLNATRMRARTRSFEEQQPAIALHKARRQRHVAQRRRRKAARRQAAGRKASTETRHLALLQSQTRQTRPVSWELGEGAAAAAPKPVCPHALVNALPIAPIQRVHYLCPGPPYFGGESSALRAMAFAEDEAPSIEWEVSDVAPRQSLRAEQAGAAAYAYADARIAERETIPDTHLVRVFDALGLGADDGSAGGGDAPVRRLPRGVDPALLFAAVVAQLQFLARQRAWHDMISKNTTEIMMPRYATMMVAKDAEKQRLRAKTLSQRRCRRRRNTAGRDFSIEYANMRHLVEIEVAENGRTLLKESLRDGDDGGGGSCIVS